MDQFPAIALNFKSGKARNRLRQLAVFVILCAISLIFLGPFAWMVATSLKPNSQIFTPRMVWVPHPILFRNYVEALARFPFWLYTRNTLFICMMTMIGTVISALLPAYGFSRLRWRGRDFFFIVMIATIMLPAQVTLLPVFLLFRQLHWIGTFLPLVVPPFFGSAFSIFLMRQFLMTIPQELSDAARIDGCSDLRILFSILAPISKPAIATIALLSFTGAWMDFLNPLIYLHNEHYYTLAIGLLYFMGRHNNDWSHLMAAATVITVPMLVIFFFAQRTFIQGIALTGLKG